MSNKLCVGLLAVMAGGYLLCSQGLRWGATDEELHLRGVASGARDGSAKVKKSFVLMPKEA